MLYRLSLAIVLLLIVSCSSTPPVHFASSPPGARILIDGQDSGFVTPTSLDIRNKEHRQVEFVLPGFKTAVRNLRNGKRVNYVFYEDWVAHYNTWRFPLWLNVGDFFQQRTVLKGELPSRLFVQMQRAEPTR
ncbi:MAG: PEGA domain-containing protein [Planctomycetota bacterium]|nr:PEGA domain-containing protein [Planctomycetota bacterium]